MGSGFSKMKKQAKMMQDQMEQMKEKMRNTSVTGSAGNGLVEIIMNGEKEITRVKINPDCVDKDDVEGLEDLIKAAFEDADKKIEEECPSPMGGMGGLAGMF